MKTKLISFLCSAVMVATAMTSIATVNAAPFATCKYTEAGSSNTVVVVDIVVDNTFYALNTATVELVPSVGTISSATIKSKSPIFTTGLANVSGGAAVVTLQGTENHIVSTNGATVATVEIKFTEALDSDVSFTYGGQTMFYGFKTQDDANNWSMDYYLMADAFADETVVAKANPGVTEVTSYTDANSNFVNTYEAKISSHDAAKTVNWVLRNDANNAEIKKPATKTVITGDSVISFALLVENDNDAAFTAIDSVKLVVE